MWETNLLRFSKVFLGNLQVILRSRRFHLEFDLGKLSKCLTVWIFDCYCCCWVTSVVSDSIDVSLPGASIPGILQARTLEWVAISFSSAWKWKVKVKSLSHVRLFSTPWTAAHQVPRSMGVSRQEYWSGLPLPSPKPLTKSYQRSLWNNA